MVPIISIIIPVYNKIKYLPNLWDNLLSQTFTGFECILIDDGSTDGSARSCDNIVNYDSRFKVFHIQNDGVSHARNVGLQFAQGEYITFIDADDSFHNDYLGNLYSCILQSDADLVIGSSLKVWADSNQQSLINVPFLGLKATAEIMPSFASVQLESGIYGYCCGKLLKASIAKSHQFNENVKLAEDLDFYLSIYPEIQSIYFDDKPYYYYLQAAENSSMLTPDWQIDYFSQLQIQLKMFNMLKDMGFLNDMNKCLLTNRIYDYVYFTLYYAPKAKIKSYCKQIRNLQLPSPYSLHKRSIRQKWVLNLFLKKRDSLLSTSLRIFRQLKQVYTKLVSRKNI